MVRLYYIWLTINHKYWQKNIISCIIKKDLSDCINSFILSLNLKIPYSKRKITFEPVNKWFFLILKFIIQGPLKGYIPQWRAVYNYCWTSWVSHTLISISYFLLRVVHCYTLIYLYFSFQWKRANIFVTFKIKQILYFNKNKLGIFL